MGDPAVADSAWPQNPYFAGHAGGKSLVGNLAHTLDQSTSLLPPKRFCNSSSSWFPVLASATSAVQSSSASR